MDQNKPDYSKYTLSELYDAQKWLDQETYPERAKEIEKEIFLRYQELKSGIKPRTRFFEKKYPNDWQSLDLSRRGIGTVLIVSGAISLLRTFDAEMNVTGFFTKWMGYAIPLVLYGGLIAGGIILLLKKNNVGVYLSIIFLFFQIPSIIIWKIAYWVFPVPAVEWKIWPDFGFGISTGHAFKVSFFNESQNFYLGINLFALIFFSGLVAILEKEKKNERQIGENINSG